MKHERDGDTNCSECTWNDPKTIDKGNRRLKYQRISGDCLDYSIIKIGQNTEESPGDSRRFSVIQTPMRNHQVMLVWKTLKGVK